METEQEVCSKQGEEVRMKWVLAGLLFCGLSFAQGGVFSDTRVSALIFNTVSDLGGVEIECPRALSTDKSAESFCYSTEFEFSTFRSLWDSYLNINTKNLTPNVLTTWRLQDGYYSKSYVIAERLLMVFFYPRNKIFTVIWVK